MWEIYDAILSRIQTDAAIRSVCVGEHWVMAETDQGMVGVAAVQQGRRGLPLCGERFVGIPVREAAELVKSWDFEEAAFGLAAINACLNIDSAFHDTGEADAFLRFKERARGKKVAVVGRFAYLEERLEPICELSVLERIPSAEDYPDSACEFILPDMDLVFITGCTVSNKTLPRLLQLTKDAFTVLAGPSTPMTEELFRFGADALCGFCVTDEERCRQAVSRKQSVFACGRMVCLEK